MELLPSDVEARTFHVVRKGYDPDEVHAFLKKVAAQMSSLEERAKIALVKADRLERKLFDAQRTADPVAGAFDDALEIRRRMIADAEAEAERIRAEAVGLGDDPLGAAREEAARLLEETRLSVEAMEAEAAAAVVDARARAERIVASAVAAADRTRDDRGQGFGEPEPERAHTAMTVDLTGDTPRIEVTAPVDAPVPDTKPSRYMSRSAGLPRIGEGAGTVLADMAKVRRREDD